ncbi:MAG TPA: hypothetical protein VI122_06215 [Thermoleophilaceae bacterium]
MNVDEPTPPVIGYAAKSDRDEHDSIGTQIAKIKADVHREKRDLTAPIYHEDARSSCRGDRGPELEAAMGHAIALANEHGSALLWVRHSSRLARGSGRKGEARSILEVLTYLLRHRVTVRSVEDNEFTTNEMLWGFAAKQANKYAADLSVWVREGKEQQWERGEWLGGPIPDGYLGVKVRAGTTRGRRVLSCGSTPSASRSRAACGRSPATGTPRPRWRASSTQRGCARGPVAPGRAAACRTRSRTPSTPGLRAQAWQHACHVRPKHVPAPFFPCAHGSRPPRQQNTVGNAARPSLARGDSPPVAAWCSA